MTTEQHFIHSLLLRIRKLKLKAHNKRLSDKLDKTPKWYESEEFSPSLISFLTRIDKKFRGDFHFKEFYRNRYELYADFHSLVLRHGPQIIAENPIDVLWPLFSFNLSHKDEYGLNEPYTRYRKEGDIIYYILDSYYRLDINPSFRYLFPPDIGFYAPYTGPQRKVTGSLLVKTGLDLLTIPTREAYELKIQQEKDQAEINTIIDKESDRLRELKSKIDIVLNTQFSFGRITLEELKQIDYLNKV